MCYIDSTATSVPTGYVGDDPTSLHLRLYAFADFKGGMDSSRSTSGAFLALVGPHSFFPVMAKTKEHGCVDHPMSVTATASVDTAIETVDPQTLCLWDLILDRPSGPDIKSYQDTAVRTVKSGKNSAFLSCLPDS